MGCPQEVASVLRSNSISSQLLFYYKSYSAPSYNTYVLCIVVILLLGWLLSQWKSLAAFRKLQSQLSNIPGPTTIPIFGNSLMLLNKENHEYFDLTEELTKKYGNVVTVWLFHKPYVLVSDADVLEKLLLSKDNLDKGDDMKVFQPWWGTGLLTASASKWKVHRKLLNPTFSHSILISFLDVFNQESCALADRLDDFAQIGKPFNLKPFLTDCTLNIICETAMGKKLHPSGEGHQEYIDAVTGMYHILLTRMTKPWLRPNFIWKLSPYGIIERKYLKILHRFTDKVIQERKLIRKHNNNIPSAEQSTNDIAEGGKHKMAFMDYLLNMAESNENTLTDTDIRNEIDTFMAAGHDTTAYTVLWTLFLLATYPEHQTKVQKELDDLYKDKPISEPVNINDIYRMTYLGLCIKESIRIYPIVPMNFRKLSQDIKCDEAKVTIPAGVNVLTLPFLIHKDPKHFRDPDKFDPERFTAENCKNRHPLAYIPFSAGPRNCIGQKFAVYEAKVILSYLLRNYHWKVIERRENIKLDLDLVTRPLHDLHFVISRRICI